MSSPKKKSSNLSLKVRSDKIVALRQRLGWTQEHAGDRSGYSDRLIRKLESFNRVRPQTLRDILQCYHDELGIGVWSLDDFVASDSVQTQADALDQVGCPLKEKMATYYDVVFQQRQVHRIGEFACQQIRFTAEGMTRSGIQAIATRAQTLLNGFNPIKFNVERMHSQNEIVFSVWSVRMKHVGTFLEFPASNRWVNVRGSSIVQFAEGLVVEAEDQFDVDDLIRQLRGEQPRVI